MKKKFEEFKKFINRGNVVDMAVGVAVASAFTAIVSAFTAGFITPILSLITGESELDEMKWVLREEVVSGGEITVSEVAILWGPFVHAIVNFFIIAATLFTVMKIAAHIKKKAEKLRKDAINYFTDEDTKAALAAEIAKKKAEEEERLAKEAAEEAARLEAEALAEKQRQEEEKAAKEAARLQREEALLTEIRDLLRKQSDNTKE